MNIFHRYVTQVFIPNPRLPSDDILLRGMMLFNLLFFLQQFEIFPYFFIGLRIILSLIFIRYINFKWLSFSPIYPKSVLFILFAWTIFMFRNCCRDWVSFFHIFFSGMNYVCLVMPFCLIPYSLIDKLPKYLNFSFKTVKVSIVLLLLTLPYILINWHLGPDAQGISMQLFEVINLYLGGGLLFCIFFLEFYKKSEKKFLIFATMTFTFFATFFARRGISLIYVMAICCCLFFSISRKKGTKKIKAICNYAIIGIMLLVSLIIFGSSLFSKILERGMEDTRSAVELEMLYQLESTHDILEGRGITGTYESITVNSEEITEREGIETGYLNLILKGGVVYLIIMAILFVPPIFLGFLNSRNRYIKILSCCNLLFILAFCAANNNMTFSIRYFLFIFGSYLIYQKKYRRMTNNQIEAIILSKKI